MQRAAYRLLQQPRLPLTLLRKASSSAPTAKSPLFSSYGLLAIPIVTFGLGTWQVFRKMRKEDLITHMEAKLNKEAVPLPHE